MAVTRQSRRKATSTKTASRPPMTIASRTLATASAHEVREVVDDRQPHRRRQRRAVLVQSAVRAVGDVEDVAADLSGDADDRGGLSVPDDQRRAIDDAFAHVGDVAHVDRRAFAEHHDDIPHVLETRRARRGEHEVLLVVLGAAGRPT